MKLCLFSAVFGPVSHPRVRGATFFYHMICRIDFIALRTNRYGPLCSSIEVPCLGISPIHYHGNRPRPALDRYEQMKAQTVMGV